MCQYHTTHVVRLPGTNFDSISTQLPSLILSFLHDVITLLDPSIGHAFITNLTVSTATTAPGSSQQYLNNNENLQFVYLDCIDECLDALKDLEGAMGKPPGNDSDSQYESDQATSPHSGAEKTRLMSTQHEKAMLMVYTLLSMIDGGPEMMRLTKKVDTLFHTLLQTSYNMAGSEVKFDVGRIYGCLLGRQNTFLLSRLQEVEEFLWLNTVSNQMATSLTSPGGGGSGRMGSTQLPEAEEDGEEEGVVGGSLVTPTTICSEAARAEWRNRFYNAMLDHTHFLESTLERGLQLIYTGKLSELVALMSKPEFVPLRPVLLLLGWDRYAASGSGKELLDALWPMEVGLCLCVFVVYSSPYFMLYARAHTYIRACTHTHTHTHTHRYQ